MTKEPLGVCDTAHWTLPKVHAHNKSTCANWRPVEASASAAPPNGDAEYRAKKLYGQLLQAHDVAIKIPGSTKVDFPDFGSGFTEQKFIELVAPLYVAAPPPDAELRELRARREEAERIFTNWNVYDRDFGHWLEEHISKIAAREKELEGLMKEERRPVEAISPHRCKRCKRPCSPTDICGDCMEKQIKQEASAPAALPDDHLTQLARSAREKELEGK